MVVSQLSPMRGSTVMKEITLLGLEKMGKPQLRAGWRGRGSIEGWPNLDWLTRAYFYGILAKISHFGII